MPYCSINYQHVAQGPIENKIFEKMENHLISTQHEIDTSNFFNFLMENSDAESIFILDDKGVILDINLGVTRSFGYSKNDVVGKDYSMIFRDQDKELGLPEIEIKTVLQKGVARDNNYVIHKSGAHVWSQGESILAKNNEGDRFIIKKIYDLNKQKVLESSLIESNKELKQTKKELEQKVHDLKRLNQDRDNFVFSVSHDLQSPIHHIKLLCSLLLSEIPEECKSNGKVLEYKRLITSSIERFYKIMRDLAAVGVESEGGELEEVSFKEIWEEVKQDLAPLIDASEGKIEEDFSKVQSVKFSRKNLRSILFNLVSNGLKYRSAERQAKVVIKTESLEDYTLLSIEDNGVGISEKDKDKVFEFGKRLTNQVEGSGIGMTLVKRIIDNMEGKIEIESEVDKGSLFKIYLKKELEKVN